MTGRLVILGSGETAPTMVEVHRGDLAATGAGPALLLDTPYGFQENADDITEKALAYFGRNVGRTVTPLTWRVPLEGPALDRALAAVRSARWVFAGPGSPTYAMRVWAGSGLTEAVRDLVTGGGTATFASAAAVTVGAVTVPVYEVYKCGADPFWAPGTNLLRELAGLHAAVIPHYDNAEGGTHSTHYCYLGERRLRVLEAQLPDGAHVIGVDEHTALVLDLATGTAQVLGRGGVTVRRDGGSRVLPAGTCVPITELSKARAGGSPATLTEMNPTPAPGQLAASPPALSLREVADHAQRRFTSALADRNADTAATTALGLEQALADWSADSLQSDDADHARRVLRGMVLALAEAARDGLVDPRERLEPLVSALIEHRNAARAHHDFTAADALRDQLAAAGVEVRDGPDGSVWSLHTV
ncbi:MAG: hypothetical protein M3Z25_18405 [Actinomycetota bacterium]|nr:hypothetical protein [Actinomycetota bacterium]